MAFELPPLPYSRKALEPYISNETMDYHYGKHHQNYVNKLNELVPNTEFEGKSLEEIIKSAQGSIFNNGAQVWNHTFFWNCMSPEGGSEPDGKLAEAIAKKFGSFEKFKEEFTKSATTLFGSGWTWLAKNANGELEIINCSNAGNPLTENKTPILTCDVWEHAYYIDTRNDRLKFLSNFWQIANWEYAEENFK